MAAKRKTAAPVEPAPAIAGEAGPELVTVWVCIHDGTEYEPGPGVVCPGCGSPDHRGKAVPRAAEPEIRDV